MSKKLICEAVVTELQKVTNIGLVEGKMGRRIGLPWETTLQPLWAVTVAKESLSSRHQPMGSKCWSIVLRIRGYFPHSFEEDSDTTWLTYLDAVTDKLSPEPAISICAMTEPPILVENDYVMYGDVLCHFALLEFRVEEWR